MGAAPFRFAPLTYTRLHPKKFPHKVTVVSDKVSTTAIEALKSAQQLDWLDISDPLAPIDQDLIDQLKAAIPNCHIVADTGK